MKRPPDAFPSSPLAALPLQRFLALTQEFCGNRANDTDASREFGHRRREADTKTCSGAKSR